MEFIKNMENNNEEFKKKIEQTSKELLVLRGAIIHKSIDIDAYAGAIIENYFVLPNKHTEFRDMVISDPYFSFGLKIKILKKILKKINWDSYEALKEDLYRVNEIRNLFAHSVPFGFDGHLSCYIGEKPMEIKKAKEMYDEFIPLWTKTMGELDKVFQYIIGQNKK